MIIKIGETYRTNAGDAEVIAGPDDKDVYAAVVNGRFKILPADSLYPLLTPEQERREQIIKDLHAIWIYWHAEQGMSAFEQMADYVMDLENENE